MNLKPTEVEFAHFFSPYVNYVGDKDIFAFLENQLSEIEKVVSTIPQEKELFAYAPGKWTLKQLLGHIVDTERIMAYRALCIARGEKASLPGFKEKDYATAGNHNERSLSNILEEYILLRKSNISLFKSFTEAVTKNLGISNNNSISVRALMYIIAGHTQHHMQVLKERYL